MQNKSLHMYYNLIIAQRGRDENFSTLSQKLQKLLQEFFPKGKILLVYRNSLVTQKLISFLRNEFADFENLFEIKNPAYAFWPINIITWETFFNGRIDIEQYLLGFSKIASLKVRLLLLFNLAFDNLFIF